MGTIVISFIAIVGLVLVLSLAAISKAYGYKHQIDAKPGDDRENITFKGDRS